MLLSEYVTRKSLRNIGLARKSPSVTIDKAAFAVYAEELKRGKKTASNAMLSSGWTPGNFQFEAVFFPLFNSSAYTAKAALSIVTDGLFLARPIFRRLFLVTYSERSIFPRPWFQETV